MSSLLLQTTVCVCVCVTWVAVSSCSKFNILPSANFNFLSPSCSLDVAFSIVPRVRSSKALGVWGNNYVWNVRLVNLLRSNIMILIKSLCWRETVASVRQRERALCENDDTCSHWSYPIVPSNFTNIAAFSDSKSLTLVCEREKKRGERRVEKISKEQWYLRIENTKYSIKNYLNNCK